MRIDILTLFPEMCRAVFSESIVGRAVNKGLLEINAVNIRDYTLDKHNRVDDTPYGGGMGMLMQAQPVYDCYKALCAESGDRPHLIYLSPQGKTLTQMRAKELSQTDGFALLCGHYEGIDERAYDLADYQISLGDYVLTSGELAAMVVIDAVVRKIEGVLGAAGGADEESFADGLLEFPQYTRPATFLGREVPAVLLSGNHAAIDSWRYEQSLERTARLRPDLLERRKEGGER